MSNSSNTMEVLNDDVMYRTEHDVVPVAAVAITNNSYVNNEGGTSHSFEFGPVSVNQIRVSENPNSADANHHALQLENDNTHNSHDANNNNNDDDDEALRHHLQTAVRDGTTAAGDGGVTAPHDDHEILPSAIHDEHEHEHHPAHNSVHPQEQEASSNLTVDEDRTNMYGSSSIDNEDTEMTTEEVLQAAIDVYDDSHQMYVDGNDSILVENSNDSSIINIGNSTNDDSSIINIGNSTNDDSSNTVSIGQKRGLDDDTTDFIYDGKRVLEDASNHSFNNAAVGYQLDSQTNYDGNGLYDNAEPFSGVGGSQHLSGSSLKKMKMMSHPYDNTGIATSTSIVSGQSTKNARPPAGSSKKVNNEQWDAMFERLKAYKAKNGDCLVPKRYAADPRLGTWVETQRNQKKKLKSLGTCPTTGKELVEHNNRLNAERLAKLDSIGFAWSAKHIRKNNTGKNGSNNNVSNAAKNNNSNKKKPPHQPGGSSSPSVLPSSSPSQTSDVRLGNSKVTKSGSDSSRVAKPPKKAPKTSNPSQKQAKLPQQRRPRANEPQWEDMYKRLLAYKSEHGDCLVPRKYEKDTKLGAWVETQRSWYNQQQRNTRTSPSPQPVDEQAAGSPSAVDSSLPTGGRADSPPATSVEATESVMVGNDSKQPIVSPPGNQPAKAPTSDDKNKSKELTPQRKQMLDDLGFVWSLRTKRIEDHWDLMFKQLVAYKEEHGDCLVPSRYESNLKLSKWVETQRQANSGNRISEERKRRLESIGFEWKVKQKMKRYYDKQWDGMFERLKAFKELNGHCMVPKRYIADPRLGTWVHTQRVQYRKLTAEPTNNVTFSEEDVAAMKSCGEEVTYRLTEERRQRLEGIGFVWSAREGDKGQEAVRITRNSYDDQWDIRFEELRQYKEKYGNCLVPKRYKENPKLGTWCDTQRVQRKKLQKKLSEQGSKAAAVEGYTTGTDSDGSIALGVAAVVEEPLQGSSSGNTSPTNIPDSAARPLVGRLTNDRIRRLDELGFVWSIRDDWQKHYDELKEYKKKHGHCNVPSRYSENRRLGIWVGSQRQAYHKQKKTDPGARAAPLTQERVDLLNQLGFTWTIRSRDTLGESWFQRLQELKAFKERFGHCLVPSRYVEAPGLGQWVGTQRSQYRLWKQARATHGSAPNGSTAMNEDRIRELNNLGFCWALRGTDNSRGDTSSSGNVLVGQLYPEQQQQLQQQQPQQQQDGDFINDNGFDAAHVLQVMQIGGHGRDHSYQSSSIHVSHGNPSLFGNSEEQHQHQSIAHSQQEHAQRLSAVDDFAAVGAAGEYNQHVAI